MKKIAFFVTSTFLMASSAFAQLQIGVKAGLTLSKLVTSGTATSTVIKANADNQTGYLVGAYARIGNHFFVQPEVVLANKGGKVDIKGSGGVNTTKDVRFNNIDIPFLLGYRVNKGSSLNFRVNAGPVASISIGNSGTWNDVTTTLGTTITNASDSFKNASYGYQAGVGITMLGIDIDLRREGSLSNISALKLQNNAQFNQRLEGWQLTAGFKIL